MNNCEWYLFVPLVDSLMHCLTHCWTAFATQQTLQWLWTRVAGTQQRMPRARLHNMLLLGTPICEKTCRIQTLWWLVKWWIGNSCCRHDYWFHLHCNDPAYSCPQLTSQASLPQKSISPIITHVKSIKIHWTSIIPYAFHMPHIILYRK